MTASTPSPVTRKLPLRDAAAVFSAIESRIVPFSASASALIHSASAASTVHTTCSAVTAIVRLPPSLSISTVTGSTVSIGTTPRCTTGTVTGPRPPVTVTKPSRAAVSSHGPTVTSTVPAAASGVTLIHASLLSTLQFTPCASTRSVCVPPSASKVSPSAGVTSICTFDAGSSSSLHATSPQTSARSGNKAKNLFIFIDFSYTAPDRPAHVLRSLPTRPGPRGRRQEIRFRYSFTHRTAMPCERESLFVPKKMPSITKKYCPYKAGNCSASGLAAPAVAIHSPP